MGARTARRLGPARHQLGQRRGPLAFQRAFPGVQDPELGKESRQLAVLLRAGIPLVDFPDIQITHAASMRRYDPDSIALLGLPDVRRVHEVVSPLALEPMVPVDRRFLYACILHPVSTAEQFNANLDTAARSLRRTTLGLLRRLSRGAT